MHNSSKCCQQAQVQENVIIAKHISTASSVTLPSLLYTVKGRIHPPDGPKRFISMKTARHIRSKSGGTPSPLLSNLANDFSMQSPEKAEDSFIVVAIGCVSEDGYEYSVENEQFLLGFGPHDLIGESGDRIYVYGN